jgi:hypothetical protein
MQVALARELAQRSLAQEVGGAVGGGGYNSDSDESTMSSDFSSEDSYHGGDARAQVSSQGALQADLRKRSAEQQSAAVDSAPLVRSSSLVVVVHADQPINIRSVPPLDRSDSLSTFPGSPIRRGSGLKVAQDIGRKKGSIDSRRASAGSPYVLPSAAPVGSAAVGRKLPPSVPPAVGTPSGSSKKCLRRKSVSVAPLSSPLSAHTATAVRKGSSAVNALPLPAGAARKGPAGKLMMALPISPVRRKGSRRKGSSAKFEHL